MTNIRKCAIIGCGFVGSATAFSYASGLFSEMVLIDVNKEKAEGEAEDISHGLPFNSPMEIYAGEYSDLSDAHIIIIAAGANQKDNETRLDLVHKNAKIFSVIVDNITQYNKEGIILVVTNPVDILTHYTLKKSGFPKNRVIGSGTVLDTARLKYLVGRHFNIDSRNVHSFIIGEHGDSELAVWSSANISGIDINKFCGKCEKNCNLTELYDIFDDVKASAYKIIQSKGATYYGIAESVKKILTSIVRDDNAILTVSSLIEGEYGINNVCIGLPCVVGAEGVRKFSKSAFREKKAALTHPARP